MSPRAVIETLEHSNDCGCNSAGPPALILARAEAERLSVILKALADPTRLQLLSMIESSPDGEACVCDLTAPIDLSQPTISHHLKKMVKAGLLLREKRGLWAWYSIEPEHLDSIRRLLPTATTV